MAQVDNSDYTAACLELAHSTALAKDRNATTFLWLYDRLIACLNCDTIYLTGSGPEHRMTVETLFRIIKRCYQNLPDDSYTRLAMAPVLLQPLGNDLEPESVRDVDADEMIRCRPILPPSGPEVQSSAYVQAGDYLLYFVEGQAPGTAVYKPTVAKRWAKPNHTSKMFSKFLNAKYLPSFSGRNLPPIAKIGEDVKAAALLLPHNQGRCVVTGTQGSGDKDPNGTIELRWIYPPPINLWDPCLLHCPELLSAYSLDSESWHEEGLFEDPQNLIMMREDIYELFMDHAFGIDFDASPQGQICAFHSFEKVKQKISHSSLAVEVLDETSRAFLREHFQQCLMSGFVCQDVKDQPESRNDSISSMMFTWRRQSDARLIEAGEWPQDEEWDTVTGRALKEWLIYQEDLLDNQDYY